MTATELRAPHSIRGAKYVNAAPVRCVLAGVNPSLVTSSALWCAIMKRVNCRSFQACDLFSVWFSITGTRVHILYPRCCACASLTRHTTSACEKTGVPIPILFTKIIVSCFVCHARIGSVLAICQPCANVFVWLWVVGCMKLWRCFCRLDSHQMVAVLRVLQQCGFSSIAR